VADRGQRDYTDTGSIDRLKFDMEMDSEAKPFDAGLMTLVGKRRKFKGAPGWVLTRSRETGRDCVCWAERVFASILRCTSTASPERRDHADCLRYHCDIGGGTNGGDRPGTCEHASAESVSY
jgi:hypothetical protein